jgi:SanA protein
LKKLFFLLKKYRIVLLVLIIFILSVIIFCDWKITTEAKPFIYSELSEVPQGNTAVLLGTSNKRKNGDPNPYFYHRIDACVELYKAGKIATLVISGDNSTKYYNEPETMRKELLKRGVPDSIIKLDFAGLRTLDSVLRMRDVFGKTTFLVVSQKFHNERAIYLAKHHGLNVMGYNAGGVEGFSGLKTQFREKFARVKVFVDLMFGVDAKHKK